MIVSIRRCLKQIPTPSLNLKLALPSVEDVDDGCSLRLFKLNDGCGPDVGVEEVMPVEWVEVKGTIIDVRVISPIVASV